MQSQNLTGMSVTKALHPFCRIVTVTYWVLSWVPFLLFREVFWMEGLILTRLQ